VDNIAIYNSTVHEIHQTSNYKEGMLFHIPLHGVSRYVGLEARQTSKPQNRRPLFDVELYLTVHKYFDFVSISLNIFIQ
jgi:hypothetical protein